MTGAEPLDFKALFEALPGSILVLAPDPPRFTVLAANDAFLASRQSQRDRVIGMALTEVLLDPSGQVEGVSRRSVRTSLDRVLVTGVADSMRVRATRGADGSVHGEERYVNRTNTPLRAPDGSICAIIHQVEDVTRWVNFRTPAEAAHRSAEAWDDGDGPAPGTNSASSTGKPRILVADDDPAIREYLGLLLQPHYEVTTVEDGHKALLAARAHPPAAVLSDVMMPGMDGLALVGALRSDPQTRRVPIVLLSGRGAEQDVLNGIDTGADDYLVKPFSGAELLSRVRTHLAMAAERNRAAVEAVAHAKSRELLVEQLRIKNVELEAYSYSVSHDLRAPLRAVDGFSLAVLDECAGILPPTALEHLNRVRAAAARMGQLIDDLLALSRIDRAQVVAVSVDLSALVAEVVEGMRQHEPERQVEVSIEPGVGARGDVRLIRVLLDNVLANAWKFTSRTPHPQVTFGVHASNSETVYFVADNGAGFASASAGRLFRPFQRLHSQEHYPGTGIGLATVARVVARHGGRVWAEGEPGAGARIFWTLAPAP